MSFSLHFPSLKAKLRHQPVLPIVFWLQIVVCYPFVLTGQVTAQAAAPQTAAPRASPRTIRGLVKSGNMPIPGASVSAVNADSKQQVNTWTDVDGSYRLGVPGDGHFTVQVQMAAFATSTPEVVLDATQPSAPTNFEL